MHRYFPAPDCYFSIGSKPKLKLCRHTVTGTPDVLHGLNILFASDFHITPRSHPQNIVDTMQSCKADLILLGGDYSDNSEDARRLFHCFSSLKAPLGIYAVRGNNDAESFPENAQLAEALAQVGIRLLLDERFMLDVKGAKLLLLGTDEYKHHSPDHRFLLNETDADYRLMVSHYPVFPVVPHKYTPHLILSGHTHGGQFNFFGINPYALGFERLFKHRKLSPYAVSGIVSCNDTQMLVSKGIGCSRIPLRIGVQPEIHLLTLA
ncbi:MAG: metallophosphoesterase family protein [Christensenellales bacterium]|nr:metallophosphoesterase family protein [Christensenellales bacterium]